MSAKDRPAMPYGWGRVPYTFRDRLPWMNLPFPIEEYRERLGRLRAHLAQDGLDCLVVLGHRADNSNIRYLTNFEDFYGGETVLVVPAAGEPGFTTNGVMHGEPMHSGIQDCWIEDARCAAAPRTVTGSAQPATVLDHLEDFIRDVAFVVHRRRWKRSTAMTVEHRVVFHICGDLGDRKLSKIEREELQSF